MIGSGIGRGSSIRLRILLFELLIGLSIVAMAAAVHLAVRQTSYYVDRVQLAHQQLEAMTRLEVYANRYSEQMAEVLLIGEAERPELDAARRDLLRGMDDLERLTDREIAFVRGNEEEVRERPELARLASMRGVLAEIDAAVEPIWQLDSEGRHDEAVVLYRKDIENRLDRDFERLIGEAVSGESKEVAEAEWGADVLARQLSFGIAGLSILLLGASLGAGLLLARSLRQTIQALTDGAQAIGRGDLDHRIGYTRDDELGLLAERFNRMADELRLQRTLLLKAQADLEGQVAQRTDQLARANARLRDLDRLRVQFLAEISHELRTPLTVLRGEAEITLRARSTTSELYRQTLEGIVDQAADMGRLVDDLLFLARSEADQIRFERRRLRLQDVVAEAIKEGTALGRGRDVQINGTMSQTSILVEADALRLKQALVIALDNAVKYSGHGQPVTLTVVEVEGGAELTVRDRGPGVPAEDLPYVFDRFYRGRQPAVRVNGGSGLGLPIAKWIVEKHGGRIALESEVGQGTVLRFWLPRAAEPTGRVPHR